MSDCEFPIVTTSMAEKLWQGDAQFTARVDAFEDELDIDSWAYYPEDYGLEQADE